MLMAWELEPDPLFPTPLFTVSLLDPSVVGVLPLSQHLLVVGGGGRVGDASNYLEVFDLRLRDAQGRPQRLATLPIPGRHVSAMIEAGGRLVTTYTTGETGLWVW